MFGSSKPTASLSSGLLARKGQARPAMRPQGFHGPALSQDDLGWNDMGDEPAPLAAVPPPVAVVPVPEPADPVPPVLAERESLAHELDATTEEDTQAPEPAPRAVSTATVARIGREVSTGKAKTAFTLRLDPDRHLRLRLASASRNRSSQALVTAALDQFLASLPEIEGLASQLAPKAKASGDKQ